MNLGQRWHYMAHYYKDFDKNHANKNVNFSVLINAC